MFLFEYVIFCAIDGTSFSDLRFENDVKMYGTQTQICLRLLDSLFENDVKMYGTQTTRHYTER